MNTKHPVPEQTGMEKNSFARILEARLSRRQALACGLSATTLALFGGALSGCHNSASTTGLSAPKLGFSAVPKNRLDRVTIPGDYELSVLWATGDSFRSADPAWSDAGLETAESYNYRAGDHHDGMHFFGLDSNGNPDPSSSTRGILCMNHEAMNPFNVRDGANNLYQHPTGATTEITGSPGDANATPPVPDTRVARRTVADEVRKEIYSHGVSVIEIRKQDGVWNVVKDSPFNRRVHGGTTMAINGPLRGNAALVTKFSTDATQTQGTINNCANGYTPWGTYLTCEENWVGYFSRAAGDNAQRTREGEAASLARYGSPEGALQRGNWDTAGDEDEFKRWDTSVRGASASADFRNAVQQFGYIVEIDPYDASSTPVKHTALGRLAHEGCWPAKAVEGKPVVFYMGDDNRGDYIYKFLSTELWNPADAYAADRLATGAKYMDSGKLYAARFNDDGTGQWLELSGVQGALDTRLAADAAGATRMDRPEWGAVHPLSGEVYFTLTNSNASNRLVAGTPSGNAALTDAANPRAYNDVRSDGTDQKGNPNGHIIRWHEEGGEHGATAFQWDIFLFGARSSAEAEVNLSGLDNSNDLSSPDGLTFARAGSGNEGLLWIQTDDAAYTDVTNCMMLAAAPGIVGDGSSFEVTSTSGEDSRTVTTHMGRRQSSETLRRFLVGPKECEITGIDSTPDGRTLFVNIQHPGEDTRPDFADPTSYGSHWPDSQRFGASSTRRPRSATIVITKRDGGPIGI